MIQIKNRLPDLKMLNSSSNDAEGFEIIDDGEDATKLEHKLYNGPVGNLLKKFLYISESLTEIQSRLVKMKSMATAEHINNFNQKEFNKIRNESMKIGNNIVKKFKQLETKLPDEMDFSTLARMKRSLYYGFFQKYIIVWSENEKFLTDFEQKLKKKLQIQSQILNCNLTDEELETLIENKNTNLFTSNILQDTESVRKATQEIQDRFEDLKKIEKSIAEVHNLFINLQSLVSEQGDAIQRIETHFDATRDYVQEATKHIKMVEQMKQTRCCKLRCHLL